MMLVFHFQCEPISGYGFRRGGYQCVCLPGYYYPWWHDGPFQGWEIEQATRAEYESGFDCLKAESELAFGLLFLKFLCFLTKRSQI